MLNHRIVFLSLSLLLLFSIGWQLGTTSASADASSYNGIFIPDGVGLKKTINAEANPLQANQSWTIYAWIKSDDSIGGSCLLGGFGEPDGAAGAQRFLAVRAGKISFWAGDTEIVSPAPLETSKWQPLAATYDKDTGEVSLYRNGVKLTSKKIQLPLPAAPIIHLAPVAKPWNDTIHFAGKIANFTLLSRALNANEIQALSAMKTNLESAEFEVASKTWATQTKAQDGLHAPQDAATLPQFTGENHFPNPPASAAKTVINNAPSLSPSANNEWTLAGGWRLLEAPKVSADGSTISQIGFKTDGWLEATVPGTVLTTLVNRGVYPDPDYGLNNLAIPETLNKQDYWYRTEFNLPASLAGHRRFTLNFYGINYAAAVWLNGKPLGDIKGAFARGTFDVSRLVIAGKPNALAVRVSPPPHPGIPHEQSVKAGPGANGGAMCADGATFICTEGWDWIPGVRDRATGIWQDVTLKASGAVKIGDVNVVTKLPLPDTSRAALTLTVPLRNDSEQPASGVLEAAFEGVCIRKRLVVAPGHTEVTLTPADFPQLNVKSPRLWWVNGYGKPELYHLKVKFLKGTNESDSKSVRFGIRELSYELTLMNHKGYLQRVEFTPTAAAAATTATAQNVDARGEGAQHVVNVSHTGIIESAEGWVASFMPGGEASAAIQTLADRRTSPHLVIRLNGVRISCKGGNWGMDDSRKRVSRERMEPFFRLHREAKLTMIRNWCGQSTEEVFYDLADEYGLLVWNDFWLSTQDWNLEPSDPALFLANAREAVLRFRHHPSIAIWCGRNEGVPPPVINEGLDNLIRTLDGTRYYTPNSRDINLQGSGPWHYGDALKFFTTRGRGFSTELGLPSPPSIDTMRAMLPPSEQW